MSNKISYLKKSFRLVINKLLLGKRENNVKSLVHLNPFKTPLPLWREGRSIFFIHFIPPEGAMKRLPTAGRLRTALQMPNAFASNWGFQLIKAGHSHTNAEGI